MVILSKFFMVNDLIGKNYQLTGNTRIIPFVITAENVEIFYLSLT